MLVVSYTAGAEVYYVSPRGNDSNTGADTISTAAWLTWLKAFNTAVAGDTVYFLGGSYLHPSPASNIGPANSGTPSSFIYFMAYPGQTPVLDCSNKTRTGYSYAMYLNSRSYIYFKGLHFRDNHQLATDHIAGGTNLYQCNYIVFEDCKSYSHGYTGFADGTCDSIFYINCDSYENYNADMSSYSGGGSDGYYTTGGSTGNLIKYINCRAWFNSDDGWDSMYNNGLVVWEGCWSLGNGYDEGDGSGFKLGHINTCDGTLQRKLTNCVTANNKWSGYNENNNGRPSSRIECYNNISYRDLYGFMNLNSSDDTYERIYRNNIAYGFTTAATYLFGEPNVTDDHNSWNGSVVVTDDDFVSLDTTELYAERQPGGSLPTTVFGTLVSGSDLIDAGTDVGLLYGGAAPDLGWVEYDEEIDSTLTDITAFTLADQTAAATINATNHTVSIEVAYTADITNLTPTITLSYGATVIPASGVSRDFTNPVPYTVTALDGVTYQEWTVTVTQAAEPEEPPASSSKIVKIGGYIIKL